MVGFKIEDLTGTKPRAGTWANVPTPGPSSKANRSRKRSDRVESIQCAILDTKPALFRNILKSKHLDLQYGLIETFRTIFSRRVFGQ